MKHSSRRLPSKQWAAGVAAGVALFGSSALWVGAYAATPELKQHATFTTLPELPQQQCGVVAPITLWLPEANQRQPLAMLSNWHRHPLAEFANCFALQTYTEHELYCAENNTAAARNRAQCRVNRLTQGASGRQVLFVPEQAGIAYTADNVMLLPETASLSLFAHEVGHWLGFADEYAMRAELAEEYCSGGYSHPSLNVVVTATKTLSREALIALWQQLPWRFAVPDWRDLGQPIDAGQQQWRLGSQEGIGLHAVTTCAHSERHAWRPVAKMTPMQYFDIGSWPDLYIQLLKNKAKNPAI